MLHTALIAAAAVAAVVLLAVVAGAARIGALLLPLIAVVFAIHWFLENRGGDGR